MRGGTAGRTSLCCPNRNFNPPAPCGAGHPIASRAANSKNFNPPAPCGAGPQIRPIIITCINFNPPAPCGAGRAWRSAKVAGKVAFQSTRPVRGGTGGVRTHDIPAHISIHPPRAGRDRQPQTLVRRYKPISIHPPRAGRDIFKALLCTAVFAFQSTRPVRGGTGSIPPPATMIF